MNESITEIVTFGVFVAVAAAFSAVAMLFAVFLDMVFEVVVQTVQIFHVASLAVVEGTN